jgi:hypothetical protein
MKTIALLSALAVVGQVHSYLCIAFLGCLPNCPDGEQARCDKGPEYCINGNAGCYDEIVTSQTVVPGPDSAIWCTSTTVLTISTTSTYVAVDTSTRIITEFESSLVRDTSRKLLIV